MALIRLEGLSVFGHHGARPYEKEAGQRLEVDLELDPVDDRAERSDRLADAVDYDQLYQTVREVVEDHFSCRRNHTYLLLALMIFEVGQRQLIDQARPMCQPVPC